MIYLCIIQNSKQKRIENLEIKASNLSDENSCAKGLGPPPSYKTCWTKIHTVYGEFESTAFLFVYDMRQRITQAYPSFHKPFVSVLLPEENYSLSNIGIKKK